MRPGDRVLEADVERLDRTVCIVGAGPAGLVLAHRLQQEGVSFVLLERLQADALRSRTRAGMIEHQTIELLTPYGLSAPVRERGSTNGVVEFRADGDELILDYGAITGTPGHYVYPQHELVGDWADDLVETGGDVRFGMQATSIDEAGASAGAIVRARGSLGAALEIRCEAAVVCDGAARGLDIEGISFTSLAHPFRWLAVIAAAPPISPRTVYALHPRGYAAQMRRAADLTRYYLQVPPGDVIADWPDDRIRAELAERLGLESPEVLAGTELVERDFVDLRVRVADAMQYGSVFLAGDAAHLITPAGGKGMNLAVQDALELAAGLGARYGPGGSIDRLAGYSAARLAAVWQVQEFSNWMLYLLHADAGTAAHGSAPSTSFAYALRRARLDRLFSDALFARWFAHRYAGVEG